LDCGQTLADYPEQLRAALPGRRRQVKTGGMFRTKEQWRSMNAAMFACTSAGLALSSLVKTRQTGWSGGRAIPRIPDQSLRRQPGVDQREYAGEVLPILR